MSMTETLFRDDAYQRECEATVLDSLDGYVILDRSVFYAMGGGQPGDTGRLRWDGGEAQVVDTRYGDRGAIRHVLADGAELPPAGINIIAEIDWDRRYRHMRMHTALHLLGAVLKYGVTGGNISAQRSRLDFDMEDTVDKDEVTAKLADLVDRDIAVSCRWITDAELAAQPELIRTMSVQPPKAAGKIRLLDIEGVDLQPCGGTHVLKTGEIGAVRVAKSEKKGKHNRRVHIELD
ncbi:MAG: alanyl-tRNA editing protein [Woeseia sp.]|nr:alanyl-tRNA editing protein [Woeseia sp.]MBT8096777.1 alanyl-tRNA editing protein [Woeseia sp.]